MHVSGEHVGVTDDDEKRARARGGSSQLFDEHVAAKRAREAHEAARGGPAILWIPRPGALELPLPPFATHCCPHPGTCWLLGLGERSPHRMLLDQATAEVVQHPVEPLEQQGRMFYCPRPHAACACVTNAKEQWGVVANGWGRWGRRTRAGGARRETEGAEPAVRTRLPMPALLALSALAVVIVAFATWSAMGL